MEVVKGGLYYDENLHFVFGSGLIKAYELESNKAKYPRIIIDDCLKPSSLLVGWEKDDENVWYLDYMILGYYMLCEGEIEKPLVNRMQAIILIEEHKAVIVDAINKYADNEYILEKYLWLKKYYNEFCKRTKMEELKI